MRLFKRLILKFGKFFYEKNFLNLIILFFFLTGLIFVGNYFYSKGNLSLQPRYGGIYREGLYDLIFPLNPLLPSNETQKTILNIIYPSLIEFDNGKPFSRLLKNYSFSADNLTFKLIFKDNLKWSNGDELTTDDLLYSIDLYRQYPSAETVFLKAIDFRVIDDKQAEFSLKNVDNYFLFKLNAVKIFPRKTFANANLENFKIDLLKIGSGPFVLEKIRQFKDIQEITLTKNSYYQPQPYLEKIVFYNYPSTKRAFDGLLLKEIDGIAGLNYFEFPQNIFFDFKIYHIVLPRVIGLFFNSQKVDKEIVNYLNSVINRQEVVRAVLKNQAEPTSLIFSPTIRKIFGIKETDVNFSFSKSVPELNKITLDVLSFYVYPDLSRYLQNKFKFNLEFLDKVELENKLSSKDYSVILMGINYSWPPLLSYFWTSTGINLNNFFDPNLEAKIQQLVSDSQSDFAQNLFEAEKAIINSGLNVFIANPYYLFILNKKIKNFDQVLLLNPESRFVKIEYWYKR